MKNRYGIRIMTSSSRYLIPKKKTKRHHADKIVWGVVENAHAGIIVREKGRESVHWKFVMPTGINFARTDPVSQ